MRSVPLWVGKTDDAPVPPRVRLRIFEREGGICHLSGIKIRPGDDWDLDHVVALHKGGRHAEDNLKPALRTAHRKKTSAEAKEKAHVEKMRQKHLGIFPKTKTPLRSRGFPKRRAVQPTEQEGDQE